MTLWIFDTDHATLFGQGNPQIVQRVSAVNPKDIAITLVTFEEQMVRIQVTELLAGQRL